MFFDIGRHGFYQIIYLPTDYLLPHEHEKEILNTACAVGHHIQGNSQRRILYDLSNASYTFAE